MTEADPFLKPNNPILRQEARTVELTELGKPEIQSEISRMLLIASGQQDVRNPLRLRGRLVGLAHPQVTVTGEGLRLVVINTSSLGDGKIKPPVFQEFVNPAFVPLTDETELVREACFSVDERVAGYATRIAHGTVEGLDRNGNPISWESQNPFQAAVGQHETQHLEGIVFVEHVSRGDLLMLRDRDPELYKRLHKNGQLSSPDNPYPYRGSKAQLENVRAGNMYDA